MYSYLYTATYKPVSVEPLLCVCLSYILKGSCGFNGEGCTLIELTLTNGFSSVDISLIPP